jgi:Mg-chelatase subunit ChlD
MKPLVKKALCALLVQTLAGCQHGQAANAIVWPTPSPQTRPQQMPPNPQRVVMRPNFEAPSATHCQRPIETRELSDGQTHPQAWPAPVPYGEAVPGMARDYSDAKAKSGARELSASAAPPAAMAPAPAPAAAISGKLADAARADSSSKDLRGGGVRPHPSVPVAPAPAGDYGYQEQAQPQPAAVTAGMVDDNAAFSDYLAFRQRTQVAHRERDVRQRYLLEVNDAQGHGVPDAEVAVQAANGATSWLRTDAGGKAWIHPDAFDRAHSNFYEVSVRQGGYQATAVLQRGQKSSVEVQLTAARQPSRAQLDLVLLVDATGSMGDEIDKLKSSLRSITDEVARLPSHPDLCLGLVAYRDRGDAFFVRSHDLTNDVNAFQGVLNALQAAAGGDEPEAMNEALHEAVHHISWRGNQTTRLVVLVADAPPHLDYGGPQYDDDMLAALGKGIKLMAVGASGLNKQGEYIQRQMAQYTGGRFIFLTYADASNPASGPGRETVHDVRNYSVQTLDKLIVRLVREELEKLPKT